MRYAQRVIDTDVVRGEEDSDVEVPLAAAADRQRVAVNLRLEVTLVLFLRISLEPALAHIGDERDLVRITRGDVDAAVDFMKIDALDAVGRPAARNRLVMFFANRAASGREKRGEQ